MSTNDAPFGLLFSGKSFIFFQRVTAFDRIYLLCSDQYDVVGHRVIKTMVGMCLDNLDLPQVSSHPALPTQVSQSTLQVGSSTSILPTRNRDGKKDTTAEQGVGTPPDLNVAFTKTVLSSKLYPVRAIGAPSEPCEEVLEIGEELGWGAFATVFKANWEKNGGREVL
ncbi:hypothetical protein BT69DRAFT_167281 [Atractiella rhizophila]|nr:hypothetical protein BT69DRAFT_167281 [Atractiella rhizophila]